MQEREKETVDYSSMYNFQKLYQAHKKSRKGKQDKAEVFPLKNGVDYLGFHFYLTESGKVIRKVCRQKKKKYKRKLKAMQASYAEGQMKLEPIRQVLNSYQAHLSHGHCYRLQKKILGEFVLHRKEKEVGIEADGREREAGDYGRSEKESDERGLREKSGQADKESADRGNCNTREISSGKK